MYDVVWSVNIMFVILIVLVAVALVYIFKYDDWYPNEQSETSSSGDEDRTSGGEAEGTDGTSQDE